MAQTGVSGSQGVTAVMLFVIVASIGVGAPVVVQLVMGSRSEPILASWKAWLIANNATVMTVPFAVLGTKMLGTGLSVLG